MTLVDIVFNNLDIFEEKGVLKEATPLTANTLLLVRKYSEEKEIILASIRNINKEGLESVTGYLLENKAYSRNENLREIMNKRIDMKEYGKVSYFSTYNSKEWSSDFKGEYSKLSETFRL
ncbi:hypothetical protein COX58_02945 [archaeon CG_4_10_14_0_2_um_filter_Archaea_38_6]|nr:MAG: hypothetical protein COX58_02945 [archaeon CG_4_10_14_0_2_um_filter_Archaea_38_6]